MKDDEKMLMIAAISSGGGANCLMDLRSQSKRTMYILEKWSQKGWWDCGVSLRTGWLTEAGKKKAQEVYDEWMPFSESQKALRDVRKAFDDLMDQVIKEMKLVQVVESLDKAFRRMCGKD